MAEKRGATSQGSIAPGWRRCRTADLGGRSGERSSGSEQPGEAKQLDELGMEGFAMILVDVSIRHGLMEPVTKIWM